MVADQKQITSCELRRRGIAMFTGKFAQGKVTAAVMAGEEGSAHAGEDNTAIIPDQADRKSTRLNSSHMSESRMPSSA